jgi:hypothetical protein
MQAIWGLATRDLGVMESDQVCRLFSEPGSIRRQDDGGKVDEPLSPAAGHGAGSADDHGEPRQGLEPGDKERHALAILGPERS